MNIQIFCFLFYIYAFFFFFGYASFGRSTAPTHRRAKAATRLFISYHHNFVDEKFEISAPAHSRIALSAPADIRNVKLLNSNVSMTVPSGPDSNF